jgi:hypothetical protein
MAQNQNQNLILILEMIRDRMDTQDQTITSINDNLVGIREVLGKLELHDQRLGQQKIDIDDHGVRIDDLESDRDKNQTVMSILNRILVIGIPAMISAIVLMAGMLWYGINNPSPVNTDRLDKVLSKYFTAVDKRDASN